MKKLLLLLPILAIACNTSNEKPTIDVMKDCLVSELGSSVKIANYEHQDGVTKEIDGVKIYDAYFNAEVKFLSNSGGIFKVGEEYKLVKVSVQLMKTEKGWNCQAYDWSNAKLVRINKGSNENFNDISGSDFIDALSQPNIISSNSGSSSNPTVNNNTPYQQVDNNTTQHNTSLKYPEVSNRRISRSELVRFSKWELRIMRNEIYAKYGYIFKSDDLRNYFNQQSWYRPRYADVSNRLTSIEKENAATIKRME